MHRPWWLKLFGPEKPLRRNTEHPYGLGRSEGWWLNIGLSNDPGGIAKDAVRISPGRTATDSPVPPTEASAGETSSSLSQRPPPPQPQASSSEQGAGPQPQTTRENDSDNIRLLLSKHLDEQSFVKLRHKVKSGKLASAHRCKDNPKITKTHNKIPFLNPEYGHHPAHDQD